MDQMSCKTPEHLILRRWAVHLRVIANFIPESADQHQKGEKKVANRLRCLNPQVKHMYIITMEGKLRETQDAKKENKTPP